MHTTKIHEPSDHPAQNSSSSNISVNREKRIPLSNNRPLAYMSYYFSSSVSNLHPVSRGAKNNKKNNEYTRLLDSHQFSEDETDDFSYSKKKLNKSMPNLLDEKHPENNTTESDEKNSDPYGVYSPLEYANLRNQVNDQKLSEYRQVSAQNMQLKNQLEYTKSELDNFSIKYKTEREKRKSEQAQNKALKKQHDELLVQVKKIVKVHKLYHLSQN